MWLKTGGRLLLWNWTILIKFVICCSFAVHLTACRIQVTWRLLRVSPKRLKKERNFNKNQVMTCSHKVQKFCSSHVTFTFSKNLARRDLLRHFCIAWCWRLLKKRSIAVRLRERLVDHYRAWLCFIGEECGFFMLNSWEPCRIGDWPICRQEICALALRTVYWFCKLATDGVMHFMQLEK